MMSRLRELASDTAIYGFTTVVSRLLTYFLVPFYTKFFGTGEYGIIGLIFIGIGFFNVFFTFGMESAYLRYAANRETSAGLFRTLQITILGVASVFGLLLFMGAPLLQPLFALPGGTYDPIFLLMIAILWFDALSTVPFAELRLARQTRVYAATKLFNVSLNVALNLVLVLIFGMGIIAVMIANAAASAVTLLQTTWLTRSHLNAAFNRDLLRQSLRFGLPYIPAGIGYIMNEGLSRFYLNALPDAQTAALYGPEYTSADITGIFNACYKLSVFMMLLTQMFRMAWQPFFMRYAQSPDAPATFADVFRWFNAAAALLFLVVALYTAEIAALRIPVLNGTIIDSRYWLGLSAVPMLLAAYWFQGWYTNFTAGIFISENTKILPAITLVGAGITIAANILLVPAFGMNGAAWASVVSYGAMALMIYAFGQRKWPVPYPIIRSFLIVLYCGGMVWLAQNHLASWIALLSGIAGTLILTWIRIPKKAPVPVS